VTYKFYKAQVTGNGYMPQGNCQATLTLDESRTPTWTDISEEFERVCLPSFESTMRNFEPLKAYSEEALDHLFKRQLPTQGFMMVVVKEAPKISPSPFGYQPGAFSPPPGLLKPPPKPEKKD
jgi:hypothetical protein